MLMHRSYLPSVPIVSSCVNFSTPQISAQQPPDTLRRTIGERPHLEHGFNLNNDGDELADLVGKATEHLTQAIRHVWEQSSAIGRGYHAFVRALPQLVDHAGEGGATKSHRDDMLRVRATLVHRSDELHAASIGSFDSGVVLRSGLSGLSSLASRSDTTPYDWAGSEDANTPDGFTRAVRHLDISLVYGGRVCETISRASVAYDTVFAEGMELFTTLWDQAYSTYESTVASRQDHGIESTGTQEYERALTDFVALLKRWEELVGDIEALQRELFDESL